MQAFGLPLRGRGVAGEGVGDDVPFVLVVMAVEAEQLPVAAVGRVVLCVVVLVVDGQLAQAPALELAAAVGADVGQEFEGPER